MNRKKVLILLFALLASCGVWAQNGWTITKSTSGSVTTFTISRTNTAVAETVRYRLVNLSAYAGQHYNVTAVNGQSSNALSGEFSFTAGDNTSRTIQVTEQTATTNAYKYQTGTERSYKLEVTDAGGFYLAGNTRSFTTGTTFSIDKVSQSITNLVYFNGSGNYTSGVSSSKYVDVSYTPPSNQVETSGTLQGYVLIDDSYDYAQKSATVSTSDLINSTNATAAYLNSIGYKIYATVCFTEKEKDDGYQYIQIVAGNGSASYDTGYDPDGSVNDPSNSAYKVCFELSDGSNAEGKQFFPHRYNYANKTAETSAGISITEFSQTNGKLWQQKFKSGYQATNSGSLIFDANVTNITTRFDAGGNNDDTWGYKDLFVRMALVDATAPTKLAVSVAPGKHCKGNTLYVSVAFNEIVTVTGTPTLTTTAANNWGSLSYVTGSGTNVLTFSTTIPENATGSLNITGLSGTVKDLAGNSLTGSGVTASNLCPLDASYTWPITYDLDGGTASNPATYTWETATFTLNNPTRTGYTFDGWTGSNGNDPQTTVTISTHTHKTLSYTANWTPIVYNISYTLDGGSVATPNPDTYTIETTDFTLVNPTRANHIFLGWTGTDLAAPTMSVTVAQGSIGDRSYTANWHPLWGIASDADGTAAHPYLIATTIDLDSLAARVGRGTTYSGTSFLQTADIAYDGTTNNYTPVGNTTNSFAGTYDGDGHTISGINISSSNNDVGLFGRLSTGATVQNLTLASSTLTAHFNVGGIVGYNNGGTVQDCRVESTVTINANNSVAYYHGGVVGNNRSGTIEGCLCAATVSRSVYSTCHYYGGITGYHNGGTIRDCLFTGPAPISDQSTKGSIAGNKHNSATLTNNYYTVSTLGGVYGNDDDGARQARTVTLGADVALAVSPTSYSHSGLTAIGTTALRLSDGTIYSGATQTLTLDYTGSVVAPAGQHHCFSYNDGSSDHPFAGNTFTMPDADITVSYVGIAYNITYNLAGGSLATPNPAFYTADSADITLVNPTRTGYTFAGWTGTGLSAPTMTVTIAHGSTGDRSYTATWTPIVYSLSYDLAGGSVATPNPTSYTVESANITLTNPTRDGYDFDGWTGTGLDAPMTTVTIAHGSTGDRSYTATWTPITYTITYDLAGGSVAIPNPTSYTVESDNITLTNPTHADNTFAGWTGTGLAGLTTTVTIPHGSTGDRTYTAVWWLSLPYSYGFEEDDGWANWSSLSGSNGRVGGVSHGGSYFLRFRGSTSNIVALPLFNAATSSLQLSFWSRPEDYTDEECGTFSVGYLTDPADAATFVALRTYSYSDWTSDDYRRKVINFAGAPAGARLAFRHNPTTGSYYWYVDDVEVTVPTCFAPEELAVSNIGVTAATFSWLAADGTQWEYALVANAAADYTPADDDFTGHNYSATEAGTQTLTLNSLAEYTNYAFFLRRSCGAESKSEAVSVRFRTPMTPTALPYVDDFESSNDWTLENGSLTNQWVWGTATSNGDGTKSLYVSNNGGTNNAYSNGSNTTVYAWKIFSFEDGYYSFSYDWRAYGEGGSDFLRVALVPDATELTAGTNLPSGFSFNGLPTGWIALDGGEQLYKKSDWQHFTTDPVAVAAGTYKMVFIWRNNSSSKHDPPAAVDNVRIAKCKHFVTDGNWNQAANWSPAGVPTTDESVFIEAAAVVPAGCVALCYQATIDGGSVTIADGGQMVCNSEIPVTVQKAVAAGQWNGISGMRGVYDLSSLTNVDYDLFRYDEKNATWLNQKDGNGAAGFTSLSSYYGYIYRRAASATIDLATNNDVTNGGGTIYTALCSDDALRGFWLVGNRYTHDLYFGTGITINSGSIAPGFYTLNPDGTWRAHTTADPIHVAESFLIQVTTDEAVLRYYNTNAAPAPSKAGAAVQSSTGASDPTLAFTVRGNGHEDIAYALLADGDGLKKMPHLTAEAPSLCIDGYAIASLGSDVESFPLTLQAAPGEYTLSLSSSSSFSSSSSYCHLIDRLAGRDIDLLCDSSYTFHTTGNDAGRFLVKLSTDADGAVRAPRFAHWNGYAWEIDGTGPLEVFDILGRRLFAKEIQNSQFEIHNSVFPAAGVYILRLGNKTQKIVVR